MLIVALKLFATRASGSFAALASLTDSLIDLIGLAALALRPGPGATTGRPPLLAQGMAVTAGLFMGALCLARILHPPLFGTDPLSGGLWGPGAALVVVGLTLVLGRLRQGMAPSSLRPELRDRTVGETVAALIAALGLAAGVLLGVPALDAAAGFILAIWMVWGGMSGWKQPVSAGPEAAMAAARPRTGPWG